MTDDNIFDGHFNIATDLKKNGCPVCNYITDRILGFFSQWVHDLSTSEDMQKENAKTHGLCPFHSWQLVAMGSPLGISRGNIKLIRQIADELLNDSETSGTAAITLHSLVNNAKNCRVCILMRREESIYLSGLANFFKFERNRKDYISSVRICLRHLKNVVMEIKDIEIVRFLMKEASKHFTAIADEMESYCEKRINSQKHLLTKSENDAYLRSMTYTVGGRQICNQID